MNAPVKADPLELANRLRPVLLHLSRHLRREVHALGVTAGQVAVLGAIYMNPGIGVGDLAAREAMSPPSVSGHLDRLERTGLVTRERAAEGDRRRVGLRVTDAGHQVLMEVRSLRTAWLAARMRDLSDADVAAIDAAVEPLRRLVDEKR
ncbi:MAG TPA: MarR family transcriptional regulator [Candidatus Dormibacteraeota bacterium]|nr:MarR family transcriptional regulator [Candidatus Dormibacteraeota bacterium]